MLHAKRDDFEVEIKYNARQEGRCYWVYAYVLKDGLPLYTRLAASRYTVQQARELAAPVWREGKDFDVVIR